MFPATFICTLKLQQHNICLIVPKTTSLQSHNWTITMPLCQLKVMLHDLMWIMSSDSTPVPAGQWTLGNVIFRQLLYNSNTQLAVCGDINIKHIVEWKTNLMTLVILFHLLCAQHVSDINISVLQASACNTGTTQKQPLQISNAQRTEN